MDARFEQLQSWLAQNLTKLLAQNVDNFSCELIAGDASFRRYFRIQLNQQSWLLMDAPPEKEESSSFVSIAQQWSALGVHLPTIYACDLKQGFMLLEDFGDNQLLQVLQAEKNTQSYKAALDELLVIQACTGLEKMALPKFSAQLLEQEINLFSDWFVADLLAIKLTAEQKKICSQLSQLLIKSALAQPQVSVHRDYHSRNLMQCTDGTIGIIDFQDAVYGPITYDAVSLLRDCYITWPDEEVYQWLNYYWQQLQSSQINLINIDYQQFEYWFDLMGMQRHLKAVGIFVRLYLRDAKPDYLPDIPRTLDYLLSIAAKYPETRAFGLWLETEVIPKFYASEFFAKADTVEESN